MKQQRMILSGQMEQHLAHGNSGSLVVQVVQVHEFQFKGTEILTVLGGRNNPAYIWPTTHCNSLSDLYLQLLQLTIPQVLDSFCSSSGEQWTYTDSPREVHIDLPQFSRWPWVTDPDLGSCRFCQMVLTAICKSYSQDQLTKLKWPEVGVGDLGTSEK